MTCTIGLGPNDDIELRTPSGRAISIPVGPHSTQMLWQILWNATAERRACGRHSYPGEFPTQQVVDAWARDIMPLRREEEAAEAQALREEKLRDRYGFDLKDLEIDL